MTDEELKAIATLTERTANIQADIAEIKNRLTAMNGNWLKNFQRLENSHNSLNGKVMTLIGILAGLGILGGGTAGVLKLLGY